MNKIYKLNSWDESSSMNDLYFDESDAIENAIQIVIDTCKAITIWEAEEVDVWRLNRNVL